MRINLNIVRCLARRGAKVKTWACAYRFISVLMLLLLGVLFLSACDQSDYAPSKSSQPTLPSPILDKQVAQPEDNPQSAPAPKSEPIHKVAISRSVKAMQKYYVAEKYNEYKAVLGADPVIKIPGPPGKLKVWIGTHDYNPKFSEDMKKTTDTIHATGTTAKITPYAPAFRVEPKESVCIQIHPTGSETGFTLTPTEEGTFNVSAYVNLYTSDNCSGSPVPKGTTTLQVQVVVDQVKERKEHAKKFWEVFWEKLLKFWGEFLVLCFAGVLFLIRKQLKKWIGFGKDN
jgi:hypothetical protein